MQFTLNFRAELETEKRCQCGYLKEEHDPQALNRRHRDSRSTLPWNFYDDTEKRPTDAYGVAVFPPGMNEMNRNGPVSLYMEVLNKISP